MNTTSQESDLKQNIRLETLIDALVSQMLEESNRGEAGNSKYLCIHQMFEALLERCLLLWSPLRERQAADASTPDTVAVMVGLLGILKVGGTYV